jgi:hypothetical protein
MERRHGAGAGHLGGAAHRRGAARGCSTRAVAATLAIHGGWRLDPRAAALVWRWHPGLPCDGGSSPSAPLTAFSLCGGGRHCRRRACGAVTANLCGGGLVTADVYHLLARPAPGEILDPIPDRAMAAYIAVLPPGGIVYGADVSWRVLRWSGVFLSC